VKPIYHPRLRSEGMGIAVRVAVGERRGFAARVLAMSALVALVAASYSLRDVVAGAAPPAQGGGAGVLVSAFLSEVGSVIDAWLVPLWALTAAAAFVVTFDSARASEGTSVLLEELGGTGRTKAVVDLARGAVLAGLSLVLGVSLGVVASQVVFRAVLVLLGAPYYVPALTPASLGLTALLALTAIAAGTSASAALGRRGRGT
jgi:hypothetical protein